MHDLMHDLAKYVSFGECAQIVGVAGLENVANTVRHICIEPINDLPVDKTMEITHLENLRTIIIKDKHSRCRWQGIKKVTSNIVEELVESSKSLRLFQTEFEHTSHFIGKLAVLKHLRFVELLQIPPECIRGVGKLYHLTTLKCRYVKTEPKQFRDVVYMEADVNLMNLYISNFSGTIFSLWAEKRPLQNLVHLELKRSGICKQLLALEKLLTLKTLKLENLPTLKKIGQELDVSGYECTDKLFWPPNLHTLQVIECPKLKEMPILPPRLNSLHIKKVGLIKLPGIGKLQNDENEKIALVTLEITVQSCQSLTSLGGSLFEEKQCIRKLYILRISDCVQLESAPLPFEEMIRLVEIQILNCPKLRTLDTEGKLLPSTSSDELERTVQNGWEISPRVKIVKCESLSSLSWLGSFPFPISLEITGCCKLAEAELAVNPDVSGGGDEHLVVPRNSLLINALQIDLPSMLLVEPLNGLCQTRHLTIMDGSKMGSVHEGWLLQNYSTLKTLSIFQAKSLQSLPSSMQGLSSLKELYLESAVKLLSLPHLPSSLKELCIRKCHLELEKKFRQIGSPERNKISHVQRVQIGRLYLIMGNQCKKETFEKTTKKHSSVLCPRTERRRAELACSADG
ncbi:unnamed protein product [Urochloa decumbens]|uniref:R13L1/DRL21-like LRR repeat region domain-containing protein n=1 Tax=Urochloa decumbens TaxID=240449 RepID=A0ABC8WL33_9POAL